MYKKFKFTDLDEVRTYNSLAKIKLKSELVGKILVVRLSSVPHFLIDDFKKWMKGKEVFVIDDVPYILEHDWFVYLLQKQKAALFAAYEAEMKYSQEAAKTNSTAFSDTEEAKLSGVLMHLYVKHTIYDGVPVVNQKDIPEFLRDKFSNWMIGRPRPDLGDEFAFDKDWTEFLRIEFRASVRAALRASLERGNMGPNPEHLEEAPIIDQWVILSDSVFDGLYMSGRVEGHPTLRGTLSSTSRLCGIDPYGRWMRTLTRWYRLGEPATEEQIVDMKRYGRFRIDDVRTIEEARTQIEEDIKIYVLGKSVI